MSETIDRDEFLARFKAEMLRIVGHPTFENGDSISDYADEIGPTYWDSIQRAEGPEECAEADCSYWGEE